MKKLLPLLLLTSLGCAASPEVVYRHSKDKVVKIGIIAKEGHGVCSGAIVSPDGIILSCAHCFNHPEITKVFVKYDNEEYEQGVVMKLDFDKDLALIYVAEDNLPYFHLGRVLNRGQEVLLLGSPLGMQHTITVGYVENIISKFYQFHHTVVLQGAAINPGNSGGPLVDLHGKLVGIGEGQVMTNPFVPANGLGFAITLQDIKEFLGE